MTTTPQMPSRLDDIEKRLRLSGPGQYHADLRYLLKVARDSERQVGVLREALERALGRHPQLRFSLPEIEEFETLLSDTAAAARERDERLVKPWREVLDEVLSATNGWGDSIGDLLAPDTLDKARSLLNAAQRESEE